MRFEMTCGPSVTSGSR